MAMAFFGHGLKVNISGHGLSLEAQGCFGRLGFGLVDGGLGLGLKAKILALALMSKFLLCYPRPWPCGFVNITVCASVKYKLCEILLLNI